MSAQAVSIRMCLLRASKSFVKNKNTNEYMTTVYLDSTGFVGPLTKAWERAEAHNKAFWMYDMFHKSEVQVSLPGAQGLCVINSSF